MKKLSILLGVLLIFGCSNADNDDNLPIDNPDATVLEDTYTGPNSDAVEDQDTVPDNNDTSPGDVDDPSNDTNDPSIDANADDTITTQVTELRSLLPRTEDPQVSNSDQATLSRGNFDFALDLFRALANDDDNAGANLFLSPHSISIALAMAYGGAAGVTAEEMAEVLHFSLNGDALHAAFNDLDQTLAQRGKEAVESGNPFKLSIANATWGQLGHPFLSSYLDLLAVNYGAGMFVEDFIADPDLSRGHINDWVADQTNDKIPELLPPGSISAATRLVLTNAIYFKASWSIPFEPELTKDAQFNLLGGNQVNVPMMSVSELFRYGKGANWQAISLPYVGEQVAMLVIVPDVGTYATFEQGLDGDQLVAILNSLEMRLGDISMPKFKVDSDLSLRQTLISLGMEAAFDADAADFSAIDGELGLSISDVIHSATVAVDEEGTEAAAATAVVFVGTSGPADPFTLAIDRPFLYSIVDLPTGAVLFMGRVLDPTSK